ncbi:hypothetical protein [Pontibacter vulgaris]|uniref:hypothetical protein n=1 Tax=Pontibacter vulgaris TaxID=2905679 RepID=UPI001FA747A2|nr:hypothetical protein [Pontibacter vulgaris]
MTEDYPDTVFYFYLPTREGRPAELIQILNSNDNNIWVPEREQDNELTAFYSRQITPQEKLYFGEEQIWRIFSSWEELQQDHKKFSVINKALVGLLKYREMYLLPEEMAA